MTSKIVVVGSLNADLVVNVPRFPAPGETISALSFSVFPGGKGGNQAFGAGRLGAVVCMVGQVGADNHGEWLRSHLASAGVDATHIGTDPSVASGTAIISVDQAGQNQIIVSSGANGTFTANVLASQADAFNEAKLVLLQLEIPLDTVVAAAELAQSAGALVILDPTPARPLPDELLKMADYLTPNESELCLLTGAASTTSLDWSDAEARARTLLSRGARKLLVKMGERGSLLVSAEGVRIFPALKVSMVDSTAAGDAFNAGFAYALAAGMSETKAIEVASAAGAFSVGRQGAQPSMPSWPELQRLLQDSSANLASQSQRTQQLFEEGG